MGKKIELLEFQLNTLKYLCMWPINGQTNANGWILMAVEMVLSIGPVLIDFYLQLCDDEYNFVALTENLISLAVIPGTLYLLACFARERRNIISLIDDLKRFVRSQNVAKIKETDRKAELYTKYLGLYAIAGISYHIVFPLFRLKQCRAHQKNESYIVPCGVVTRARLLIKNDVTFTFPIIFVFDALTTIFGTAIIIAISSLLVGVLMHVTTLLRDLRESINKLSTSSKDAESKLRFCVYYHIKIIKFSEDLNGAFSNMMLLHITLTSFVISILGAEAIFYDNRLESVRFGVHMVGWLVLLFLVCYYGQLLIDESAAVAEEIYETSWYNHPIGAQKTFGLMMMRAQKPLNLTASKLGVMSFPTFLNVMSSAYSYFTLLLKLKSSN